MSRPVHTQFAMKAIDLAILFNTVVGADPVLTSDANPFKVELSTPDGQSTGGGKQSVQHIKLVRLALTVVVGSADQVEKTAELRSFDYVNGLHGQRYKGAALPIDRATYDAFQKRAREFLSSQGLSIVVKDAAPSAAPVQQSVGSSAALWVVAFLLMIAIAGGVFFFVKR